MFSPGKIPFPLEERVVQNHMVGNINPRRIPNQLIPVAAELARTGQPPFALVTMSQEIMHNMGNLGPGRQVVFGPIDKTFNSQAAQRHKEW